METLLQLKTRVVDEEKRLKEKKEREALERRLKELQEKNKEPNKYSKAWEGIKKGFSKASKVVGKAQKAYFDNEKRQGGGLGLFR